MPDTKAKVGHVNEMQDGEMKQVTVGETDVLLVKRAVIYGS